MGGRDSVMASQFGSTGHVDTFARDNLPPVADWPVFDAPLVYPAQLNCAAALLDVIATGAHGDRPALHFAGQTITYRALLAETNRIAHILVDDLGVVPGNRVLLRGPNNPMMVACWFAVLKAGAIAVTTMPLSRTRELTYVLTKARVTVALCDGRFADEMHDSGGAGAPERRAASTPHVCLFHAGDQPGTLEALSAGKPAQFANVATASDDVALIAFTSGSTGQAKGTMHFHRDVLAICDCFSAQILQPTSGRCLLRHAAARFHLRARWAGPLPLPRRRIHRADRAAQPKRAARRDPALPGHDPLHRADDVPPPHRHSR